MKTFETEIIVQSDRTAVIAVKLPEEVREGKYRALLLVEDRPISESVPGAELSPPLRWEGPLVVYDGTLPDPVPDVLEELRRQRLDGLMRGENR
ncbi:MAG: hypothetical protein ACLQNE_12540 [Thermoguttaceae bacterium]